MSKFIKERELDLNSFTSLERKQFLFVGVYPLQTHNKWEQFVHMLRFLILLIFSSILCVSMTISLILGVDKLSDVTAILYYLITQSAYVIKLFNIMAKRSNLLVLEEYLNHPIAYKYFKLYGHKKLDSVISVCRMTGATFRFCCLMVLIFYILTPLLSDEISLPMAGWMPIDKVKYRGIVFTLQILCYTISAFTNSSFDIYAAIFISLGVGQLRVLKDGLSNIDYSIRNVPRIDENRKNADGSHFFIENHDNIDTDDRKIKISPTNLEELVQLHKHCIRYITVIEQIFSNGIFVQFLASVCVICLTGFQMLVVPIFSVEFVLLAFYFSAMLFQVILYCWYGNEILSESGGIGNACYMTNWYEGTQKQKKVLLLIMERSKRDVILTAGKIFILSLTTLVLVSKTSYSYFAVLRRLYKNN